MVLPGGKEIATKTLAIAGGALVAVAGVTVGVMLVLNGQKSYRNISVIDAIGGVAVFRKDVNDTFDAYKGMTLFAGDDVTVGANSELDMQLDDDKWVYIEENTHMWLEADGDAENSKTIIYLNEGAVLNKIDNKLSDKSVYEVRTPNATMSIRGTVVRAAVYEGEDGIVHSDFAVPEGKVEVRLHTVDGEEVGEPIIIEQGFQCKTRGDEDFSEVVLQPVEGKSDEQQTAPIDLQELPVSTHQILADIVMSGRPLYVGEREVLNDETHVFLVDPSELPKGAEPTPDVTPEVTPEPTAVPEKDETEAEAIVPAPTPVIELAKSPILERMKEAEAEPTAAPTPETNQVTPSVTDNTDDQSNSTPSNTDPGNNSSPTPTPTPTPSVNKYTVTFKTEDGSAFGTQLVEEGKCASKPVLSPTTSGSWGAYGDEDVWWINFSTPITQDVTIVWQEDIG